MPNEYNPGREYTRSSGYGQRFNGTDFHSGIDYGAAGGTDVRAASGGVVVFSAYNRSYGNTVIVKHSRDKDRNVSYALYAHMNGKDMPTLGADVEAGDKIGEVGNSDNVKDKDPVTSSGGEHLHLEVLVPDGYEDDDTPFFHSRDGVTRQHINNLSGGSESNPINIGLDPDMGRVDPETFTDWPSSGVTPSREE